MKTIVTLALGLLLCATPARAQVSFNIRDCSPYTTGAGYNNVATNTCLTNTGIAFEAWCSMIMPAVTRVGFIDAQAVINAKTSQSTMPDWWRQDTCRPAGFLVQADAGMGGSCPTLWDLVPGTGVILNTIYPTWGPNAIRYLLTQVLASADAYDLVGDGITEQSVFKFTVTKAQSVGSGACAGCLYGTCLQLSEIDLHTLTDTPDTYLRLTGPLPGATDYITYNAGAPCLPTPARNRTWGAVKALYR